MRNQLDFLVRGRFALFSEPFSRLGGEKSSYHIPTYEALKGVLKSIYWKPGLLLIIDRVRVLNRIRTEAKSMKPLDYGGGNSLAIYTYLFDVAYQIQAHIEFNPHYPELAHDRIDGKHYAIAKRMIEKGGRRDIFLGTRECQAYVEPCVFGEGAGFYDDDEEGALLWRDVPRLRLSRRDWSRRARGAVSQCYDEGRHCRVPSPRGLRDASLHSAHDIPQTAPSQDCRRRVQGRRDRCMSWLKTLADTYDLVPRERIGVPDPDDERPEEERPVLLPICHTTNLAHIEVRITETGEFRGASLVDKKLATTIIPCTEDSANPTGSKPKNQPLANKLQYLAGDFAAYGGKVTSGFSDDPGEPYRLTLADLEAWCSSPNAHPKVKAILSYLKKGCLVKDLIGAGILHVGEDGRLLRESENDAQKQGLLKLVATQDVAFVRWKVAILGDPDDTTWRDPSLWKSWSDYYISTRDAKGLCYVSGTVTLLAEQHPGKIRNSGDKAKLISSNDTSGFTFRGRFIDAEQACAVGLITTQKAHNALRWLFARQGDWKSGLVAWVNSAQPILKASPTMGADDFEDPISATAESDSYDAGQYAALQFRNKIRGYYGRSLNASMMVVLGLDSATPGRMALTCYRELPGSEYLANLGVWHGEEDEDHVGCISYLDYGFDKIAKRRRIFVGAPAPKDIAVACYGSRLDDKLLKDTILRLLPCIIDAAYLPWDLVSAAVERAKRRSAIETWEWNKNIGITCALFRKFSFDHDKRRYEVSLDEKSRYP